MKLEKNHTDTMEKIVKLAAEQRDGGVDGQTFIATSMFALGSVCAASDFPEDEVQSLTAAAIKQAYKKPFKNDETVLDEN
tara:strand:- start:199 stop:438 length:240 start_codon:yes stop_codon:yes gene_type:complete